MIKLGVRIIKIQFPGRSDSPCEEQFAAGVKRQRSIIPGFYCHRSTVLVLKLGPGGHGAAAFNVHEITGSRSDAGTVLADHDHAAFKQRQPSTRGYVHPGIFPFGFQGRGYPDGACGLDKDFTVIIKADNTAALVCTQTVGALVKAEHSVVAVGLINHNAHQIFAFHPAGDNHLLGNIENSLPGRHTGIRLPHGIIDIGRVDFNQIGNHPQFFKGLCIAHHIDPVGTEDSVVAQFGIKMHVLGFNLGITGSRQYRCTVIIGYQLQIAIKISVFQVADIHG